jgi:membrane-bound lytic murein transglycosylase D
VLRKIQSQRIDHLDNFWDLYQNLPRETAEYVPRFMAVLHILSHPENYGLSLPELETPREFDEAEVETKTSLKIVARCLGIDPQELADLNPELRNGSTPDKSYRLRVPKGTADTVTARLMEIPSRDRVEPEVVVHRVRKGESLRQLAQTYRTSVQTIMELNNLQDARSLKAGRDLKIPTAMPERDDGQVIRAAGGVSHQSVTAYRVKKGDCLWTIADRFKTSEKELRKLNRLPNSDIREGQVLRIPVVAPLSAGVGKNKDRDV